MIDLFSIFGQTTNHHTMAQSLKTLLASLPSASWWGKLTSSHSLTVKLTASFAQCVLWVKLVWRIPLERPSPTNSCSALRWNFKRLCYGETITSSRRVCISPWFYWMFHLCFFWSMIFPSRRWCLFVWIAAAVWVTALERTLVQSGRKCAYIGRSFLHALNALK